MTLRIHFTADDLARTRIAAGPRPLLELGLGIRLLQKRTHPMRFDSWHRRAVARLRPELRTLFALMPPGVPSAEVLDLSDEGSPAELLDRLRAVPEDRLRGDLEEWAARRAVRDSPATRRLSRDPAPARCLAGLVKQAHDQFIAPHWSQVSRLAAREQALRLRHMGEHGVGHLLNGLNPRHVAWRPPVLHLITSSGIRGDVHLGGRGLLLIPTVFGAGHGAVHVTATSQPWITFPVRSDQEHIGHGSPARTVDTLTGAPDWLAALLGRTRATVLVVIAGHPACTTTQLAAHARISPASASEHATVLRNAGLTALVRSGKTVLHTATPAALTLLNSTGAA
ncbi:DUF5937 family protein [Streptomyces sp. NPDC049577]|uniref:ArsR/SmtB family transcription factor n=1 Tax=Streptomyces sp. NPDC049577 TaxID=3155153 RepID=UPI003417D4DB